MSMSSNNDDFKLERVAHFQESNNWFIKDDVPLMNNSSVEVATYSDDKLTLNTDKKSTSGIGCPHLKEDIRNICTEPIDSVNPCTLEYIGSNLYEGFKNYEEKMISKSGLRLSESIGCFTYIKELEDLNRKEILPKDQELLIISSERELTDLILTPFENSSDSEIVKTVLLTCIGHNRIMISKDSQDTFIFNCLTEPKIKDNDQTEKIEYSNIAFKNLVNDNSDINENNTSLIVENCFNESIKILLQTDTCSFNEINNSYTDLLCFSTTNMSDANYRKKLLSIWARLSQLPSSDLLFGLRDNDTGLLYDIKWMSIKNLYDRCNEFNLPYTDDLNYSPKLAKKWYQHLIMSIEKLVSDTIKKDQNEIKVPITYRLIIKMNKDIQLVQVPNSPINDKIPQYLFQ